MHMRSKLLLLMGIVMVAMALATGGLLVAHFEKAETDNFVQNYASITHSIAEHIADAESTTDALLANAVKALSAKAGKKKLSRKDLVAMRNEFSVSNLYLFDPKGYPVTTTNEILSPDYKHKEFYSTFSLFSVCEEYKDILQRPFEILHVPLTHLSDLDLPAKFTLMWDPVRKQILESSLNAEFLHTLLVRHLHRHDGILSLRLATPNGKILGEAFLAEAVPQNNAIAVATHNANISVIDHSDRFSLFRGVGGKPWKDYCEAKKNDIENSQGEYFYVLHMDVTKTGLKANLQRMYTVTFVVTTAAIISALIAVYFGLNSALRHMHRFRAHILQASTAGVLPDAIDIEAQDELGDICATFNDMTRTVRQTQAKILRLQRERIVTRIVSQIMHDIRSPLVSLDMAIRNANGLPEEKRVMVRDAVHRIRDIAHGSLRWRKRRGKAHIVPSQRSDRRETQSIATCLMRIVSEKRVQYQLNSGIKIEADLGAAAYGAFIKVQGGLFKRVLSNLIDNAVEAVDGQGQVRVALEEDCSVLRVSITDDGHGIPAELIDKLGRVSITHGKKGGNGLGLFHAQRCINKWGGTLSIESQLSIGTVVKVELPRAPAPSWHRKSLTVKPSTTVIVVDDDPTIHRVWDIKLGSLEFKRTGVHLLHFSSPEKLLGNRALLDRYPDALYLLDYEFRKSRLTGLDLADRLGLDKTTLLVTSHVDDAELQQKCVTKNVGLVDKSLVDYMPLILDSEPNVKLPQKMVDAVLLDDDVHICRYWLKSAHDTHLRIDTYTKPDDLFASLESYPLDTAFYVDCHLGEDIRGENILKTLYARGFNNLSLATGYDAAQFPPMPWVKAIVGKEPFWLDSTI